MAFTWTTQRVPLSFVQQRVLGDTQRRLSDRRGSGGPGMDSFTSTIGTIELGAVRALL